MYNCVTSRIFLTNQKLSSVVGFSLWKVALALFRGLVQKEIGYKSEQPGYAGLIDEAQNYMVVQVHLVLCSILLTLVSFVAIAASAYIVTSL